MSANHAACDPIFVQYIIIALWTMRANHAVFDPIFVQYIINGQHWAIRSGRGAVTATAIQRKRSSQRAIAPRSTLPS
jgi:hypothetical protein